MHVCKTMASGRSGVAALLWLALLPQCASAVNTPVGQGEPQHGLTARQAYNPAFALAPGFAPAIDNLWPANAPWLTPFAAPVFRSITDAGTADDDPGLPSFDIGGYDAMWDDTTFSEIAAYGGLERDALRVAGMRALNGADGTSGDIPYGRLTLQREFQQGKHQLALSAYGTQVSVQPTAISGFGDDGYTDVAVDGTWRWVAHPERSVSDTITAHGLVLHEGENLIASHAIFGTRSTDELMVFRGDVTWSWGANLAPTVQYFRITGSADPVRLGTLDGSPDSKGLIAEINYRPSDNPGSPLNWFDVRLSLQYVAYSEFDGSSRNASQNNTVLLHLTAGGDSGP
jgi:hypothetical protein